MVLIDYPEQTHFVQSFSLEQLGTVSLRGTKLVAELERLSSEDRLSQELVAALRKPASPGR